MKLLFQSDGASSSLSHPDVDSLVVFVNDRFDNKEDKIKSELREDFERRLYRERQHQEEVVTTLKRELSMLTKVASESEALREQHKVLYQDLSNQQERMFLLKEENLKLKTELVHAQSIAQELDRLRSENESLVKDKTVLELRCEQQKIALIEKDEEVTSLKQLVDSQYKRIKLDLTNTKCKFITEQESLQNGLRQQNLMLTEISEAVRNLTESNNRACPRRAKASTSGDSLPKSLSSTQIKYPPKTVVGRASTSTSLEKLSLLEAKSKDTKVKRKPSFENTKKT